MPLMLAIIGGPPSRFGPFVELYHRALDQLGVQTASGRRALPGYVSDTDKQARDELWPHYRRLHDRIGRERGWGPTTRERFEAEADHGSLYVGSPETVAAKVTQTIETLASTASK